MTTIEVKFMKPQLLIIGFVVLITADIFSLVCVERYNHTSVIPRSDVKSKDAYYNYLKKNENKKNYCLWRNWCCCTVRNEFQALAALVLNSVTDSIVRLTVLKFSAAAFIALTVSWLLIRSALTTFSVISFDLFTNSSVYCGVTIGKFQVTC